MLPISRGNRMEWDVEFCGHRHGACAKIHVWAAVAARACASMQRARYIWLAPSTDSDSCSHLFCRQNVKRHQGTDFSSICRKEFDLGKTPSLFLPFHPLFMPPAVSGCTSCDTTRTTAARAMTHDPSMITARKQRGARMPSHMIPATCPCVATFAFLPHMLPTLAHATRYAQQA